MSGGAEEGDGAMEQPQVLCGTGINYVRPGQTVVALTPGSYTIAVATEVKYGSLTPLEDLLAQIEEAPRG